jgi:hypothetical protein
MMNKWRLLYLTNNEVPPTLLLRKKLSVMIIQPHPVPHPNVLEGNPSEMPAMGIGIKATLEVL